MPQQWDENGNLITTKKQQWDENGNPIGSDASSTPAAPSEQAKQDASDKVKGVQAQNDAAAASADAQGGDFLTRLRASEDNAFYNMVPHSWGEAGQMGMHVLGAITHPIRTGMETGAQMQATYEGARARGNNPLTSTAEGLASLVGIDAPEMEEAARRGDYAGVIGEAIPAASMVAGGEAIKFIPKAIEGTRNLMGDIKAASSPELTANVRGRLSAAQVEAQKALKNGRAEYLNKINDKTAAIKAKDVANPLPAGAELKADPIKQAMEAKTGQLNAEGRLAMPTVARVYDLVDKAIAEGPMSFERLQQLRSDIGQLTFNRNLAPVEKSVLSEAYHKGTDMMANRAGQLGETDAFNRYNTEYQALKQLDHDHLNDLLEFQANPNDFWKTVTDKGNQAVQNMLDRFGQHGNVIRQMSKDVAPLTSHLATKGESGFTGRMRAIAKQPIWAAGGAAVGGAAGHAVPGMGPWVGSMVGASMGANFGERVGTAAAMREGSPFALGAQELNEGGQRAIIPEQKPWQSNPATPVTPPAPSAPPEPGAGGPSSSGNGAPSSGSSNKGFTERVDSNGIRWAKTPGSPAEVSIPKDMKDEDISTYVHEKSSLQSDFAKSRAAASKPLEFSGPSDDEQGLAKDLYGKEFSKLTSEQQTKVKDIAKRVQTQEAAKGKEGEGTSAVGLVSEEAPKTNAPQMRQSHSHEINRLLGIINNPAASPEEIDYAKKSIKASEEMRSGVPKMKK